MGMEQATGDFFIFIDSDCTVSPQWLKIIDRELHREKADAFGGRDSFRADFPDLLKAINYSMTSFITTGGLRGRKGKKLAKFYPRSFNMGLSRKLSWRLVDSELFGMARILNTVIASLKAAQKCYILMKPSYITSAEPA